VGKPLMDYKIKEQYSENGPFRPVKLDGLKISMTSGCPTLPLELKCLGG